MSSDINHAGSSVVVQPAPLPEVRLPGAGVSVRVAVAGDIEFIDGLQKMHTHMVGWFPKKQIEANIESEHILIAAPGSAPGSAPGTSAPGTPGSAAPPSPLGYCIAKDRYMSRDDVGIIYQLNVLPIKQRHLIGATLVKEVFERAAYGCKLFSCWCAQDIQANWFWESIGFVPLAFRTGSRSKQRIHIFWQRRIRECDDATPYWFPSQTHAGAVREDRLVFPIPPDTHWRDAKPVVLPGVPAVEQDKPLTLPGGAPVRSRPPETRITTARKMAVVRSRSKHLKGLPPGKAAVMTAGGVRYVERGDYEPEPEAPKPKRPRKPRQKHDPKHVAAARELRDRFLEQVNDRGLLPAGWTQGKYDVSRQLEVGEGETCAEAQRPLIEAT